MKTSAQNITKSTFSAFELFGGFEVGRDRDFVFNKTLSWPIWLPPYEGHEGSTVVKNSK